METNNNPKVGDLIFLFYDQSGLIAPARVLEKTVKETLDEGLKVEFLLEVFIEENGEVSFKKGKFTPGKSKMFSSLEDLRVALEAHVRESINSMMSDCEQTYNLAKKFIDGDSFEKNITP